MNGVGIIGTIVIGILAGWIAEKVMKRNDGMIMNLIIGVAGAFIGGFLANFLHISFGGWIGNLVISTGGAILLLLAINLFRRRRA